MHNRQSLRKLCECEIFIWDANTRGKLLKNDATPFPDIQFLPFFVRSARHLIFFRRTILWGIAHVYIFGIRNKLPRRPAETWTVHSSRWFVTFGSWRTVCHCRRRQMISVDSYWNNTVRIFRWKKKQHEALLKNYKQFFVGVALSYLSPQFEASVSDVRAYFMSINYSEYLIRSVGMFQDFGYLKRWNITFLYLFLIMTINIVRVLIYNIT